MVNYVVKHLLAFLLNEMSYCSIPARFNSILLHFQGGRPKSQHLRHEDVDVLENIVNLGKTRLPFVKN